jgi:hypothetical protein
MAFFSRTVLLLHSSHLPSTPPPLFSTLEQGEQRPCINFRQKALVGGRKLRRNLSIVSGVFVSLLLPSFFKIIICTILSIFTKKKESQKNKVEQRRNIGALYGFRHLLAVIAFSTPLAIISSQWNRTE